MNTIDFMLKRWEKRWLTVCICVYNKCSPGRSSLAASFAVSQVLSHEFPAALLKAAARYGHCDCWSFHGRCCASGPLLLAVVTCCSLALLRQDCQKRADHSEVPSAQTENKNWKTEPTSQHMLSYDDLTGELQQYHKNTVIVNILLLLDKNPRCNYMQQSCTGLCLSCARVKSYPSLSGSMK